MRFYFNHTTSTSSNVQESFEALMSNYSQLTKRDNLSIERGIFSEKDPSDIKLRDNKTLRDLIYNIRNRELKGWVISQFKNFPMDVFYEFEDVYKDYEEIAYSYYVEDTNGDKIEATHLLIPCRLGWCVLSIPVSDAWKSSKVELKCYETQDKQYVLSFNGENDENYNIISEWIILNHYNDLDKKNVETKVALLKNSIGKNNVLISSDFEEQFQELPSDIQSAAIKIINQAHILNKLFPIKSDNTLIKKCNGKENKNTYELRDIGKGLRIYFQCCNNYLLLGGIHTKSEGEGIEQSEDINRASVVCEKMRNIIQ